MGLRTKVLRGGAYMFLRQGLGIIIGTVGVILLTRAVGPRAYGLYGAALGIYIYLATFSRLGVDVYLIRREEEPCSQDYDQAFSLLLVLGLAGAGAALLALPLLERWVGLRGFGSVAVALFVGLPINLIQMVPLARLERALHYRSVASIEFLAQMSTYLVALPLAYKGLGSWAPVAGWWANQLFASALLYK